MNAAPQNTDRFLTTKTVSEITSLGKTTIYKGIKQGTFPRQVKLGARVGWLESEVRAWMQNCAAQRPH